MSSGSKKYWLLGVAAIAALGALGKSIDQLARAADPPKAAEPRAFQPKDEADEKAIRATADKFVKAFNAGDANAIGAEWAADGVYTDESGEEFHGRDAITQLYADLFKEHP